jgi:hypothetical protein
LGQFGHLFRSGRADFERIEHESAKDAEGVRNDAREFDVGALQQLDDAIAPERSWH